MSDEDAKRLINWVAAMCWGLTTGTDFATQVDGHEDELLSAFRSGEHPDDAAAALPNPDN